MKKTIKLLAAVCFVTGIAALNATPYLSSLYTEIESLALAIVPDGIERFVSALGEKLA